ncbi:hypothetical protein CDAR_374391 [Caerostris darwini]|uniref:Uncharacterized protein n=1 Tax=Caerostris darwini TaxID=1538125 RepID=A0AAV4SP47_9ARAC|nr:hypothetical protein CDAR_374391 [Caerostris darwini]
MVAKPQKKRKIRKNGKKNKHYSSDTPQSPMRVGKETTEMRRKVIMGSGNRCISLQEISKTDVGSRLMIKSAPKIKAKFSQSKGFCFRVTHAVSWKVSMVDNFNRS